MLLEYLSSVLKVSTYQKFITPGQQQENKSSSCQRFYDNLDNEQYRKKHEKGYKKITEIFSQSSQNISWFSFLST